METGRALLDRAANATHVRGPESTAFHVRGRFVFAPYSKQKMEGTYAFAWTPQGKWREEISVGDARRLRVGEPGRFVQRQEMGLEVAVFHIIARVLDLHANVRAARAGEVREVSNERKQGRPVQCVTTRLEPKREREICVDTENGLPVSETVRAQGRSTTYEFSEFSRIGSAWFPRSVKATSQGRTLLEIALEEPDTSRTSAEALFVQPVGAKSWANCEEMQPARPTADITKGMDNVTRFWKIVYVHGVVEADGSVRNPEVLYSLSETLTKAFLAKLRETPFEPARCNGQPVASEQILVLDLHFATYENEDRFTLAAFRGLLLQ